MKNKLPIYLDNLELPKEELKQVNKNNSYGYVSILTLLSTMITLASLITIIIFNK